ncbi:hypothetical protein PHLH4_22510 [Pseudomonas sp. St316]|nr:hypothetical protein PHLH4_22510 [Pseudomonas sp. St316]
MSEQTLLTSQNTSLLSLAESGVQQYLGCDVLLEMGLRPMKALG